MRITENSATLIDVILASNTSLVKNAKTAPCLCDASPTGGPSQACLYQDTKFQKWRWVAFQRDMFSASWFVFDIFDNGEGKENTFHLIFKRIIEISGSPIGSLYQAPAYTRYTTLHINIIIFSKHFLISPTACWISFTRITLSDSVCINGGHLHR